MSEMLLEKFVLGPIENNNYLLIDEKTKEAVMFDCTEENGELESTLEKHGATLKYILLTHAHFDHVLGVNYFRDKYKCTVCVHESDKELLDSIEDFAKRFGCGQVEIQEIDCLLKDNDVINFGDTDIKVIHTPGHTLGSVCYLVGDKLFSGDTLFYESVGRTDLPGGSFEQIKSSIQNKLFKLDDNIKVYPGHGWESTIEHEKKNNNFL